MYKNRDLEIWDKKFDNLLIILQNEYQICIDSLRNVDEKANKYLVVLSIVLAATFTALSSNLTDNIKFTMDKLGCISLVTLLSIVFSICLILGMFFAGRTFLALLDSMKLIKTERMPTYLELVNKYPCNEIDFKGVIIQHYQLCIDKIKEATYSKQTHINRAEKNICLCSFLLIISLIILVFIKFIGAK